MAKQKCKTHSGLKKRVKITKGGKIIFKKCGTRHLRVRKGSKRVRVDRYGRQISVADRKNVASLLPYSL